MSKNNISSANGLMTVQSAHRRAFTFIEVMVALTIVSISLLALIKLNLISIAMTDTAQTTSQAVFLVEDKIAETLACGWPKEGADSGTVEKDGLTLHWQRQVKDVQPPELEQINITGLRQVLVNVRWKQGIGRKYLQMYTYVADRKLK